MRVAKQIECRNRRPMLAPFRAGQGAILLCGLSLLLAVLLVGACGPATPTEAPSATSPSVGATERPSPTNPSAAATEPPASPTKVDTPVSGEPPTPVPAVTEVVASVPLTTELKATVVAGLPPTPTPPAVGQSVWGDVETLSLEVSEGEPPLWAVFTVGMGFYDWEHGHLVAIYSYDDDGWQELGRTTLTDCAEYVGAESLVQVELEPSRVWLEMQSGAGVHTGCYDLLSFDGQTLRHEVTHVNSSPGAGYVTDLDDDGLLEVVLNWTENYVFCYACSVRLPMFDVLRWDGMQLVDVALSLLPEAAPDDLRRLNDRAVELAQAGLWKDALDLITRAEAAAGEEPEFGSTVAWNGILIRMHAEALAEQVSYDIYPLLSNVFYGDYGSAVDVMRPYSMEEIWGIESPLILGTVAEGWELALSDWISWTANLALQVEPDPSGLPPSRENLAAAFFLRGWAAHLRDASDPAVRADVEQAAELAPDEPLFSESAAHLRAPVPATPAPSATPVPTATPKPAAQEQWGTRTLLAGPGEPGRLYVLLTEPSSGGWPAERARFLISDDYGGTWSPFPGGLPAHECVVNVNLDYATPDALHASTCQGLYRWSGDSWLLVSPVETGMVAVVYGQPDVIWATESFASGAGVFRSVDGGASWTPAGTGLVSFNGVANVAIDPQDANTLYAVIWPKYGGSYLRRGTAEGQWQTMPTPLNNAQIDTGMTIDGATGALYVTVFASNGNWQLWRTLNPKTPDVSGVQWELVHDFGPDVSWASLLASGWSPEGLAFYANLSPWLDKAAGRPGPAVLHRSLDAGQTWTTLSIP